MLLFSSPTSLSCAPATLLRRRCLLHLNRCCATGTTEDSILYAIQHGRVLVRKAIGEAVRQSGANIGVDATCGRGSDTLTLGRALGPSGMVHAVDIQRAAVDETMARYEDARKTEMLAKLVPFCGSHEYLDVLGVQPASAAVIVYNLGWYPADGADRSIITRTITTLNSLESAKNMVKKGGAIIITTYIGHDGGEEEALAVDKWISELSSKQWSCAFVQYPNRTAAPSIYTAVRLR